MSDHLAMIAALCSPEAISPGIWTIFLSLLLAGLAGGAMHCTPMCGPFVLGQVADRMARTPIGALCESSRIKNALLLPYHAGRLVTYAGLGALASRLGAIGAATPELAAVPSLLLAGASLFFFWHAARRALPARAGHAAGFRERGRPPSAFAQFLAKLSRRIDRGTPFGRFLLGITLGFLPCGLLYGALTAAAASDSLATGAASMLCFGAGTIPALVVVGIAGQAAAHAWQRGTRRIAPLLLLLNAAALAWLAWERWPAA